jgi:enamine deaminase RidA (YjgF/YER057c/UK114 family)
MIERTNAPTLSQPPGPGYSHVVIASGRRLLSTAGAVPLDAEGNLVGAGDRHAQARQTLQNLALALEAVGPQDLAPSPTPSTPFAWRSSPAQITTASGRWSPTRTRQRL